jgi:hypothetical protein
MWVSRRRRPWLLAARRRPRWMLTHPVLAGLGSMLWASLGMDMKETDGGGANEKDTLPVELDGCGTRYIIAQGGREAAVERERRMRPERMPRRGSILADLVGEGSRTGEGFASVL